MTTLTVVEGRILQLLAVEPTFTAKSMAREIDVSARTVERYLKILQQKGRLQRTGARKGGT